jgi:hypothetical protein
MDLTVLVGNKEAEALLTHVHAVLRRVNPDS